MKDRLSAERWHRIKQLFWEALEREDAERAAFLQEACAGDRILLEEVQALLTAHAAPGPLDEIQQKVMKPFHQRYTSTSLKGRHIGPYALIRKLGRGGMATVFLAERTDGQFEQQVAIKLLGAGFTPEGQTERFLAERQILARLNHPNIARLYDGGITDEGHPYFVMEYVDGQPIDEYCDSHRLPLRDRLALFQDVCHAVQYAHRALVVHRDLKPSNILVTEDGTVKLLDFGIAKLLNPEALHSHLPPVTRSGLLPMTPAYASPEQVRGDTITTTSDIYQLGVVLYELLAGRTPYQVHGHAPSEVERVICNAQPVRPSTASTRAPLSTDEAEITPEVISQARQTSPDQLRSNLRGDLDTIVLKALRKEPERRYDSVEQLADDLRRHLEGRPVMAHPDSLRYRARKFVRRHRWGVAVASVILLLLIGYGVTITWHSQQTQAALGQAQDEAQKSEQAIDFLVSMFERATPYQAGGPSAMFSDTLTTRELLDLGALRARQELSNQPDVQATMLYTLGRIYRQLGRYDEAEPLLEEALALQREHLPENHPELAESLHELARLLRHRGELERPARLYNEAIAIQQINLGEEHPDIAENLSELAIIAARSGSLERADSLFRKALSMRESLHGPDHPDVAIGLQLLAQLHMMKEELPEAERMLRRSLTIQQKHLGPDHPHVADPMDRLGQALVMQERIDEAEPLLRQALAIRDEVLPAVHPARAISLNNMGRLLREQGEYAAAEELLREAHAIYQEMYGPETLDAASTLSELAKVHQAKGDYVGAERLYKEAIDIQQSQHGRDNYFVQQFVDDLKQLYEEWNRPEAVMQLQALLADPDSLL